MDTERTRILTLNRIPAVEVEENELGLPVTASFHVKVPPRHNGVFQVNIHGDTNGTHIISANSQFLEKNPKCVSARDLHSPQKAQMRRFH